MNIKTNFDLNVSLGSGGASPAGPDAPARRLFELHAGGLELTVVRFRGREAVSALFNFEITFLSDLEWAELHPMLLGQAATLAMHADGVPSRLVNGIASELAIVGEREVDGVRYRELRMRLVPRMHLLKHRRNSRIFQEMTVVDIVSAVLREAHVPYRWATIGTFPRRAYCLQHEETDYEFVRRLLAEEGVFFFFQQPVELPFADAAPGASALLEVSASLGATTAHKAEQAAGDVGAAIVVFGNSATAYLPIPEDIAASTESGGGFSLHASISLGGGKAPDATIAIAPSLPYRERAEALRADHEAVHAFALRAAVRTNAVELRDYDFQKPALKLVGRASLDGAIPSATASLGARAAGIEIAPPNLTKLEFYDHRGDYEEPDAANPVAQVHLEQHRADATRAQGESSVRRLGPGHLFALADHALESMNHAFVVTKVRHKGSVAEAQSTEYGYENSFECVPSHVAIRPRRPKPRLQQVVETAVVTGPAGEEIHTDRFGRIKVQFRWDREGKFNEYSSCWMRVPQPWAGASWGVQFIPRIGMEVLITFLGGDVDRPIVMGAAYNGTHPVPFTLPREKTRSGIRTQSTPGGEGFNELSFEDSKGHEQVYLHAQRDLVEHARHDHTLTVDRDERVHIQARQSVTVGSNRDDAVHGRESRTVGGAQELLVGGSQTVTVRGGRRESISKELIQTAQSVTLGSAGPQHVSVAGSYTVQVGTPEKDSYCVIMVEGRQALRSSEGTTIESDGRVELVCGSSRIVMTPEKISFSADSIELAAKKSVSVSGEGPTIRVDEAVTVTSDSIALLSKQGSLYLDEHAAHLDGPRVLLTADPTQPVRSPRVETAETKKLRVRMCDADRKPHKNKTYVLSTQGFRARATTDNDGFIDQDIPHDAFVAEITLWTKDYPAGPSLRTTVHIRPMAPASVAAGAAQRLKSLGYEPGLEEEHELSPSQVAALTKFQHDHGIALSGKLDAPTVGKLTEVFGS